MPLQVFDRINDINAPKLRSMSFEKYFGEMKLTKEQKKERIALAEDIEDVMLFFFYLVLLQSQYSYMAAITSLDVKQQLSDRLYDAVAKHTEINSDMQSHIDDFVDETNRVTIEHLMILNALSEDAKPEKRKTEEYYLSDDRARFIAEEESNSIFNSADYYKAKQLSYKTKTWHTMRDRFVRKSHERVEGKTIPIDELFMVGNSFMRFARDTKYNPSAKETVGCRCIVTYNK